MSAKLSQMHAREDSRWITVKQAADYLGVGVDTIYDACAKRGLKHAKLGRATIRLTYQWLDAWVESRVHEHPERQR